ncbi:(R)-amidase [Serratia fonticola]|uniref:(R)-amidase n=1 Tax=Serratia fonticola TaxID=47917 RepID=A0A559TA90_SERFO|nr:carbon-nitrogen hydrolase family protein [Serratia fonticola]TQI80937.1 (R)-amidase [Serratia fonticola]TQI97038.1 (R)-amidase [Serratia fonticola]TVZ71534.1 (R)-amidase [Serratia fonticola]
MRITLAQFTCREGDIAHNLAAVLAQIDRCRGQTDLLVFPETQLTGFTDPDGKTDYALSLTSKELEQVVMASRRADLAVAVGFLEQQGEQLFNSSVLITPEQGIYLHYRKSHLWTNERAEAQAGDRLVCGLWRGRRIGLLICYDIEFPEASRALALMGCDLLLVTDGNMDPYGHVHRNALLSRAQDNQMFVAMANRAGQGCGMHFAGESLVADPLGREIASLGREADVLHTELDFSLLDEARSHYRYLDDRRLALGDETQWQQQNDEQRWWPLVPR